MQAIKRFVASSVALLSFIAASPATRAEEVAASLEAKVSFEQFDGIGIESVRSGEGFVIAVRLKDVVTGQPFIPKDGLQAWIRLVAKSNSPCRQAVRNYRAAEGRLPIGALDLNGMLLANLTREGNLHVLSPKLDLAQANILSSSILTEIPVAMLQHPTSRSLLFSLRKAGRVMQLRPFENHPSIFAEGLAMPGLMAIAPSGGLWIEEIGKRHISLLDQHGKRDIVLETNGALQKLVTSERTMLALTETGTLVVASAKDGTAVLTLPGNWKDAALFDNNNARHLAILDKDGDKLLPHYFSNTATRKPVALAAQASKVSMSPDGRWAFAFDASLKAVSVVDMASGVLATAIAFKSGVTEIAFSEGTAYFRLADNSGIASMQLSSLGLGRAPTLSFHDFGVASGKAMQGENLLLPLGESGFVIAVQSGSEAGFVINGKTQMTRSLPQTGIRFRGGAPLRIAALKNGFSPSPDGALRAAAMLNQAGAYELVLSTGLQGLTSCIAFSVDGDRSAPLVRDVRLVHVNAVQPVHAGRDATLTFSLQDEQGEVLFANAPAIRFVLLNGGWRKTVRAQMHGTGAQIKTRLPLPGIYVVQPLGLAPNLVLRTTTEIKVLP